MTLFWVAVLISLDLIVGGTSSVGEIEGPKQPLPTNSKAACDGTSYPLSCYSGLVTNARDIRSWLPSKERKLLQIPPGNTQIDAVVAKDGSGQFTTISDAVKVVPDNSDTRFVIYVKEGIYVENVLVEKTKTNVMIIGDGMDATIVSGSLSSSEGNPIINTATFAVLATDFIARDIGFQNTVGAAKNQAVALAVAGDRGVFYRCKMVGFQDTLYAQVNRQLFRDCAIYGTIDFICGDSAAIFQNCDIRPRKPLPGQFNTITAQSRTDPSSISGFLFQDCNIIPAEDLTGVKTFLGRPWMNYSRTIFMHTYMDSLIDPLGWVAWTGTTAPDTVYYVEFDNYGPGAVTTSRVEWKGLHLGISSAEATMFSANYFIGGSSWLPGTGVPFDSVSCGNRPQKTAAFLIFFLIVAAWVFVE